MVRNSKGKFTLIWKDHGDTSVQMLRENWMPAALGCSKALPATGILRRASTETCAMCWAEEKA